MDTGGAAGLALGQQAGPEGPQGTQGPQGIQGAQGPEGPQGPAGSNATVTAGNGITVTNGEVSLDAAITDALYWKQGGNVGTDPAMQFLGTTDDKPMDIRVNNRRSLRIQWAQRVNATNTFRGPNVIGGFEGNSVAGGVIGATVFGGWELDQGAVTPVANSIAADFGTISGGSGNHILTRMIGNLQVGQSSTIGGGASNSTNESHAFVGGGIGNAANGGVSVIGGGQGNEVSGNYGTIGGGSGNEATTLATICGGQSHDALGQFSFVGGGSNNDTAGSGATIGGGFDNIANGEAATVPGGRSNSANGAHSLAAGYKARANHSGSFVWSDPGRGDVSTPSYGPNQFFVAAAGGIRLTRAVSTSGLSTTNTNAAVMIEKLDGGGEALWIRQRLSDDSIPVVKMHRAPTGENDFVQGLDWAPPNNPVGKFHINKNGSFVAGSDFAEALPVVGNRTEYEPGDVVVLSKSQPGFVEKCAASNDTNVAGVFSTRPGVIGAEKGGGETRIDAQDIPVAIIGIVPTKVSCENGPIAPGDLLTTSPTPGYAMKAKPIIVAGGSIYPPGAIVGKALEPLANGKRLVRVLITLR
jgi:hypothetical protein